MTQGFSEAETRLLDRFGPPPLGPGFADRVIARLPADTVPPPRRRDARGGWRRGRIALIAGVGSALLSVGAAATGLLGARVQNMPVITTIATAVDAPRAKPSPVKSTPVRAALVKPKPKVTETVGDRNTSLPVQAPSPEAARLAEAIEARMKRRDARGLGVPSLAMLEGRRDAMVARGDPRADTMSEAISILRGRDEAGALPPPRTQRQVNSEKWRARMAGLSPDERAAAEARREWRRQQRATASTGANPALGDGGGAKAEAIPQSKPQLFRDRWMQMTPEQRAEWRAKRAAREAMMTPEQRERFEERRKARRERMLQGREGLTGGPEPAPPESDVPQ